MTASISFSCFVLGGVRMSSVRGCCFFLSPSYIWTTQPSWEQTGHLKILSSFGRRLGTAVRNVSPCTTKCSWRSYRACSKRIVFDRPFFVCFGNVKFVSSSHLIVLKISQQFAIQFLSSYIIYIMFITLLFIYTNFATCEPEQSSRFRKRLQPFDRCLQKSIRLVYIYIYQKCCYGKRFSSICIHSRNLYDLTLG